MSLCTQLSALCLEPVDLRIPERQKRPSKQCSFNVYLSTNVLLKLRDSELELFGQVPLLMCPPMCR